MQNDILQMFTFTMKHKVTYVFLTGIYGFLSIPQFFSSISYKEMYLGKNICVIGKIQKAPQGAFCKKVFLLYRFINLRVRPLSADKKYTPSFRSETSSVLAASNVFTFCPNRFRMLTRCMSDTAEICNNPSVGLG